MAREAISLKKEAKLSVRVRSWVKVRPRSVILASAFIFSTLAFGPHHATVASFPRESIERSPTSMGGSTINLLSYASNHCPKNKEKFHRSVDLRNFSWLGIKNDYRTLIGVDSLDIIEKEEDDDSEENSDV